jgi:hypothetical protein
MADARQVPAARREGLPKLPPDAQYAGPLDGVPRVYIHAKCGVATEMPEEFVRSYLADPWLYNDWVWCCGCNDNIRQQDLTWSESGERLSDYFGNLRAERQPAGNTRLATLAPVVLGVLGAAIGWTAIPDHGLWIGAAIGVVFGLLVVLGRKLGLR